MFKFSKLIVSVVLVGLVLTAAVTEAESASPSKLRVGVYAYITNIFPFDEMVARYEKTHPGVEMEILPIAGEEAAWQALTQKMQLEAQHQESSWDILIGVTPFVEPGTLAKLGLVRPLDDLLPEEMFDDMYDGVREELKFSEDGKTYTLPWWTDVYGLIYRPSMLQEAVGTDQPPQTWDEVIAYCKKIKATYGDKIACLGSDWGQAHRMFIPIMGTFTKNTFIDPGVFNLADPAVVTTLNLMRELYEFMPATASEPMGSAKSFQAGGVAMELYWQAQYQRAIQAGVPEDDIALVGFPRGDYASTVFWTGGAVIPTYAKNPDEALRFMLEGMLDEQSVRDCFGTFKIVPLRSFVKQFEEDGTLADWVPPLVALLDDSQPIPSNPYYLGVEMSAFREEAEKMLLLGQSAEDTITNLSKRIGDELAKD